MAHCDFLICSERSGSNLITKILDAHPKVCGPFPSHLLQHFCLNLWRYGDLASDRSWRCLLEDAAYFLRNGQSIWKTSFTAEDLERGAPSRSLADIFRFVYTEEARANGKRRVFVKENYVYSFLPFLLAHFPEARYVYMVRDPRDMALTWKEAPSAPGQVRTGARQWLADQRAGLRVLGFLGDRARIHLLRFEDLITETEREVEKICGFLGLDYTDRMLRFHENGLVVRNAERLTSWTDLAGPINRRNVGVYRSRLGEAEIRYVERLCWEEMEFFGYAPDLPAEGTADEWADRFPAETPERRRTAEEERIYTAFDDAKRRIRERRLYRAWRSGD